MEAQKKDVLFIRHLPTLANLYKEMGLTRKLSQLAARDTDVTFTGAKAYMTHIHRKNPRIDTSYFKHMCVSVLRRTWETAVLFNWIYTGSKESTLIMIPYISELGHSGDYSNKCSQYLGKAFSKFILWVLQAQRDTLLPAEIRVNFRILNSENIVSYPIILAIDARNIYIQYSNMVTATLHQQHRLEEQIVFYLHSRANCLNTDYQNLCAREPVCEIWQHVMPIIHNITSQSNHVCVFSHTGCLMKLLHLSKLNKPENGAILHYAYIMRTNSSQSLSWQKTIDEGITKSVAYPYKDQAVILGEEERKRDIRRRSLAEEVVSAVGRPSPSL